MRYMVETPLYKFDAWMGGLHVLNELCDHQEAYAYIENYLDDYEECVSEPLTAVEVNDFLWFDALDLLEENGLYSGETGLYIDDEGFEEIEED